MNDNAEREDSPAADDTAVTYGVAEKFTLRLYVTGTTPRSAKAIVNVRKLCEKYLDDYDLEVIDILADPDMAKDAQIIAAPTLIKKLPLPLRRFIGDMSQTENILRGLGIATR
jgi:circadian clock protein KaiB